MKKVVIIGGGVAGLTCASTLTNQSSQLFDITLIEKKDFIESGIYSLRMMVRPDEFESTHILLKDLEKLYTRNGHCVEFITGARAISLNDVSVVKQDNNNHEKDGDGSGSSSGARRRSVTIVRENGNEAEQEMLIEYDYLVLATGSMYSTPYVKPDPSKHVSSEMRKIEIGRASCRERVL